MQQSLEEVTRTSPGFPQDTPLIKRVIQLIQNWPWILLSMVICLAGGLIYLRYATPKYEISSSILVKDDTKGTDLGEAAILENLGLSSSKSNVDNEVEILKSRTLMETVVADLQLNITYFAKGKIKTTELFEKSPIVLRFLTPPVVKNRTSPVIYSLDISKTNKFTLSCEGANWQQAWGDTLILPEGKAILTQTKNPKPLNNDSYSISISFPDETVRKYSRALHVSATNKQVSIITLKLTDMLPFKGEAVLSKLIENYLKESITGKNRIADSTIAFIDDNLALVTQELTKIETQIENYRVAHHITDLPEQSRLLLTNKSLDEKEQADIEVQLSITESLLKLIKENSSSVLPTYVPMQNPGFVAAINKYNEIQMLRDRTLNATTNEHPTAQNFDLQLKSVRDELTGYITSRQTELQLRKQSLSKNIGGTKRQINEIPANERTFLDHARQQQIKQELYLFLLKKRIETLISKSSTLANGHIIDDPKADDLPVSPDHQLIILVSLLIGLLLPILYFNIRDIFNIRITSKRDLTDLIKIPVIGEIGSYKNNGENLFDISGKHGFVGEQFRTLRTNLSFVPDSVNNKVIIITSSMAGEGKTFIAINLCRTLQLSGKRVILVECDLRKPTIGANLGIKSNGLSEYIIGDSQVETLIKPSGKSNPFDVIIAGIIPPNPAELLEFDRLKELLVHLRKQYDYVVLDSAPFNLVTDARILGQHADVSLYVIRQNFTFRHQLENLQEISNTNALPKLHLILNDVKNIPGYAYGYGIK